MINAIYSLMFYQSICGESRAFDTRHSNIHILLMDWFIHYYSMDDLLSTNFMKPVFSLLKALLLLLLALHRYRAMNQNQWSLEEIAICEHKAISLGTFLADSFNMPLGNYSRIERTMQNEIIAR
jgi:hypothetical protein